MICFLNKPPSAQVEADDMIQPPLPGAVFLFFTDATIFTEPCFNLVLLRFLRQS